MNRLPFLSGSRAYGTPRLDSDHDLVMLVDDSLADTIWGWSDGMASIRFGALNIIAFTNPNRYDAWKAVTEELIARKPVTRDEAVAAFKAAGFDGLSKDFSKGRDDE